MPKPQGLYDPQWEHDACGIGAVVNISGRRDHAIVEHGKQVLLNLMHRGASGSDESTGDGPEFSFKSHTASFMPLPLCWGSICPMPKNTALQCFSCPRPKSRAAGANKSSRNWPRKTASSCWGCAMSPPIMTAWVIWPERPSRSFFRRFSTAKDAKTKTWNGGFMSRGSGSNAA